MIEKLKYTAYNYQAKLNKTKINEIIDAVNKHIESNLNEAHDACT